MYSLPAVSDFLFHHHTPVRHPGGGPGPQFMEQAIPDPSPWRAGEPVPLPWAVSYLISAIGVKEAAAAMANKDAARQIIENTNAAISEVIDEVCGTRFRVWPFPGPPPWPPLFASDLAVAANTLQEGTMRTALLQLAGQILEKRAGQKQASAAAAGGR